MAQRRGDADAEQVYDRRATRWGGLAALGALGAVTLGALGFTRDWPYWWAPPLGCAALALFSFSRFGVASEFDLPENRLACAIALLRGLHQRGQVRGDLTLDVEHKLKAEVIEGASPIGAELKVGAQGRDGSRRVQRQRWLLLDLALDDDARARFSITDFYQTVESPYRGASRGPLTKRRYSILQLHISAEPATSWVSRTPAHEEVTSFDSRGRGTTNVVTQGREPGIETAEALLQALERVQAACVSGPPGVHALPGSST